MKVNFVKILNKRKTARLSLFLWIAISLSVICVPTSIVGAFREIDMNNKVYRISVYRDDLYIGSIFSKQQTVMLKDDNVQIKMDDLIISDGHLQTINGHKKGVFSLVYGGKRYFVNSSNVNSTIGIVDGDIVALVIKNIDVGNLTYDHNTSSAKVTFILKLIFWFLTFYSLVFFGFGLRGILEKLNSIKNSLILLDSGSIYGKILVSNDDFYVVYACNEYVYIPKNRIVNINPLEINKGLNKKHKRVKEYFKFKKK